jgi:chaperone required for assembly of F1-ATPase
VPQPDEDFQAERWGADAAAMARREAHWREFAAATIVLEAMRAPRGPAG